MPVSPTFVDIAIRAELDSQTPPRGGTGAVYTCPACPETRTHRQNMRLHLNVCVPFRAYLEASVRRADLTTTEAK